jgi:hypothetical protein
MPEGEEMENPNPVPAMDVWLEASRPGPGGDKGDEQLGEPRLRSVWRASLQIRL